MRACVCVLGGRGTRYIKVTTNAPPFRSPLFQVSGKFVYFLPLYFSKKRNIPPI